MIKDRLGALADGIFSIVMTLLVFEIQVPSFEGEVTDAMIWESLTDYIPSFGAYVLSFLLLYTYWRAHAYSMSIFVKELNNTLVTLNGVYLLAIAMIPFSTLLMGSQPNLQLPIIMYAANIIICGIILQIIVQYVIRSKKVENTREFSDRLRRNIMIRGGLPIVTGFFAIGMSFVHPATSIFIFLVVIMLSYINGWIDLLDKLFAVQWDEKGNRV